ncbi:MAG: 16S rRNA (cytosine(1402)-N(4))-methyltransferase RsmH [Treponema sp.]|jgi:16S rRNA (cytosine1402-N4)-methyltransferase|nr:16S rRNA (cytosine(1402)-N(4))-methyltransferase RsmH [Treponema sp.]
MKAVHTPVLPAETIQYLAPRKAGELMVDANLGEGGHAELFLSRFPELHLIGIDADPAILVQARKHLAAFGSRIEFYSGWSQDFFAAYLQGKKRPDTILFDLGISFFHYEMGGRGFSFRKDEPLDMRLDTSRGERAADLLARLPERELADLIYKNGEERYSRHIARGIVEARRHGTIAGSAALAAIVERSVPPAYRRRPLHSATRTFQALRIAVNGELDRLPELLGNALEILESGGRMGVISFHSLEDRIVKCFFRDRDFSRDPEEPIDREKGRARLRILTRKPLAPGEAEIRSNPASRSAKLRVVEKLPLEGNAA